MSVVLLLVAVLGLVSTVAQWLSGESVAAVYVAIVAALGALVIAYLLNRTSKRFAAGFIAACVPTVGGFVVVVVDPSDPGWFAFMALNPMLGRIFLPMRWSVSLAAVNLAVVAGTVVAVSDIDDETVIVALVFNAIVFAVLLASSLYSEATERDRQRASDEWTRMAETILEGTFGGIAVVRRGVVVEANQEFLAQFGPADSDARGRPLEEFFDAEALAMIADRWAGADGGAVEIEAVRRDGTTFTAEVLARRTIVDDEPADVLAIRDVTERKLAEEALRRAERTESIARLAAVVAHDANNELFVISALSDQVARERAATGEPSAAIRQIDAAAERVATLIRRVLLYDSRPETDSDVLDIETFIAESAVTWRHVLGRNIDLRIVAEDAGGYGTIEASRFAQVMLNLILNARDAIDGSGEVIVTASVAMVADGVDGPRVDLPAGRYHRISVSDNGSGIPHEHLSRVFDAFFTTKGEGVGAGLGLYASQASVREVGGEITIDTSDRGTTVTVYLRDHPAHRTDT